MTQEEELKQLWHTVFEDEYEVIDTWFDCFYRPELTAVIRSAEVLAAMAYVMPVGTLKGAPCCHIYAVAVNPSFRGLGLGIAVTNAAVELARRAGFSSIMLHPADAGLFDFYRRHCGFETAFSACLAELTLPVWTGKQLQPVSSEAYLQARARLLKPEGGVLLSPTMTDCFTRCGGRLYIGDDWCAAAEEADGQILFREWLTSKAGYPDPDLLAAMADGLTRAELCAPSIPGHAALPFGMLYGAVPGTDCGWPGLALE